MITEFLRFLIVGVISNLINFLIYGFLYFIGINLFFASFVGYSVGILISYTFGRLWVFGEKIPSTKKLFISFFIVYIIGGIAMSSIIVVSTNIINIDYRISWVMGAIYAVFNNFVGQKLIVFKKEIKSNG